MSFLPEASFENEGNLKNISTTEFFMTRWACAQNLTCNFGATPLPPSSLFAVSVLGTYRVFRPDSLEHDLEEICEGTVRAPVKQAVYISTTAGSVYNIKNWPLRLYE